MRIFIVLCLFTIFSCKSKQLCNSVELNSFTHYQINTGAIVAGDGEFDFSVLDKPNGNVIFNLPSDEESGWGVTIIGQKNDYFKIENIWSEAAKALNYWEYDWMNDFKYVWIEKGSVGVNTQNYDRQTIYLYQDADKVSKVVGQFNNVQTVVVWEACEKWAFVEAMNENGKVIKGWLSPKDQCSNPYGTCN